jgi:hypothetical protein
MTLIGPTPTGAGFSFGYAAIGDCITNPVTDYKSTEPPVASRIAGACALVRSSS